MGKSYVKWVSGNPQFVDKAGANLMKLDVVNNDIYFGDDVTVYFGDGGDFSIEYASGTDVCTFATAGGTTFVLGAELDYSAAAADITVASDTQAALEFYDATTKYIVHDTRVTVTGVTNVMFTGMPLSMTAASGVWKRTVGITPGTTTLVGGVGVTAMEGIGLYIAQPTLTSASSPAVALASTVYIADEPLAAGTATITAGYALKVAAGAVYFGGGEINVSGAATDLVIADNLSAALEITDGTTTFATLDTRDTVTGITNVAIVGIPSTITAASGVTKVVVSITPGTTTLSGSAGVTAMEGIALNIAQPTITSSGTPATASASTVYIAAAPLAAGTATITAGYALNIAAGTALFGGDISVAAGAVDLVLASDTAAALEFYDGTTKFIAIDTRNTVSAVTNMAITAMPSTITAGGGVTKVTVSIAPGTTTLSGSTGVNAMEGIGLYIAQPTITSSGTPAVASASTLYIAAEPTVGGTATITAGYALHIASGTVYNADTTEASSIVSGATFIAGGVGIAKKLYVGGDLNLATNAIDIFAKADTAAAWEFSDSTTKFLIVDTRDTVTGITNMAFEAMPSVITAASGVTKVTVKITPGVTTLTGAVGVTAMEGIALNILAPTITSTSAPAVALASTVYIANAPTGTGSGPASVTVGYALKIAAGDVYLGGGVINVSNAATDLTVKANTTAALEIYDGTTKFVALDTRNTVTAVTNVAIVGIPTTISNASGTTKLTVSITPGTTTLSTATGVTAMEGIGLYVAQPTLTSATNPAVALASTVYIADEPLAAGTATITAGYALKIAAGDVYLGGSTIDISNAATDLVLADNAAAALEITDTNMTFVALDTRDTVTAITNVAIVGIPSTITAAGGVTKITCSITPGTTTLSGGTGVTAMEGIGLYVAQPTITSAASPAVALASTVYIADEPLAAGTATITSGWALKVAAGDTYLGGAVTITEDLSLGDSDAVIFGAGPDIYVQWDGATMTSGPASGLWAACPSFLDPNPMATHGFFFDFHDVLTLNSNFLSVDDGGTGTNADVDVAGGAAAILTAGADNDHHAMTTGGEAFLFVAAKKLWFEARFRLTEANTDDSAWWFGLTNNVTTGGFQIDALGPLATYDGCMIWKDEDSLDIDFETSNAGGQATGTAITTFTSGNWTRVGFYFDGTATTSTITPYVDGVAYAAQNITLAGLDEMHFAMGVKASATNAAETLEIDFVKIIQLR